MCDARGTLLAQWRAKLAESVSSLDCRGGGGQESGLRLKLRAESFTGSLSATLSLLHISGALRLVEIKSSPNVVHEYFALICVCSERIRDEIAERTVFIAWREGTERTLSFHLTRTKIVNN